jgi:hypothetical protein
MTTNWVQRNSTGTELEWRVGAALIARGWSVDNYGQGAMKQEIREALHLGTSGLRWNPDLIAVRGREVRFVDCKASLQPRPTGRHAIEQAAVGAHNQIIAVFNTPVFYVFEDMTVLTPRDVLSFGEPGRPSTNGSGQPYYLVNACHGQPFDAVFGVRTTLAAAA